MIFVVYNNGRGQILWLLKGNIRSLSYHLNIIFPKYLLTFPSPLLDLSHRRCEGWGRESGCPSRIWDRAPAAGSQEHFPLFLPKQRVQTWTCFWHQCSHSGTILLERGEYPRSFVWILGMCSVNGVGAGTGQPPKYQSLISVCSQSWGWHGSPFPWQFPWQIQSQSED